MATNLVTFNLNQAAVTARNAEYTGTPLTDIEGDGSYADPMLGCNKAGSNACGIGIGTGNIAYPAGAVGDENPQQWTLNDQFENGRTPQDSQHIGGIVDAAPEYEGVPYPTPAQSGDEPVTFDQGADINDTADFVVADTAAADGDVADTVTGTLNRTGATIAIGDILWGNVPVA